MSLERERLALDGNHTAAASDCGLVAYTDRQREDDQPLPRIWLESDSGNEGITTSPPVAEQLELLARFSVYCSREKSLAAILQDACLVAADGTVAEWVTLLRYHADEKMLVWQAGVGSTAFRQVRRQMPDATTAAGSAWMAKRLIVSAISVVDQRFLSSGAWSATRSCRAASVPIGGGDAEPFGVLQVALSPATAIRSRDLLFLDALAADMADIIRHPATLETADIKAVAHAVVAWSPRPKAIVPSIRELPGGVGRNEKYG